MRVKKVLAVVVSALGGVFLTAGIAYAEDVVVGSGGVPIPYTTEKACISDGPDTHLEVNDEAYPYWYCQQGDDGSWYLHNTDTP